MKLKDYRIAKGLTLSQFGRSIDVAESTISRYERGRVPEPDIMERIYDVTAGAVGPLDFYKFIRGAADGGADDPAPQPEKDTTCTAKVT